MSSAAPSTSRGLFAELVRLQAAGERSVLATPLWSTGSVPLSAQSKLLFRADGSILGTIGGGPLEARALQAAPEVLAEDRARVLEFELTQDEATESGMICGGRCAILVEPISPDRAADVFAAAARAQENEQPIVLITLLAGEGDTQKLALLPDDRIVGPLPNPALVQQLVALAQQALAQERPRFVQDPVPAHFDPLLPRPAALIFGAGHLAIPVAHLAGLAGFRVVVIDDRADFANRDRFPGADQVLAISVEDAFRRLPITANTYIIAITRGHAMDEEVVAQALRTCARYIGMIGSKRKVASVLARLRSRRPTRGRGFSDTDLSRLHAPIGLDIRAETVEEIAVSIVAELIAVHRGAARDRG
jgi:xanthine dehydrogenase accessory factor